MGTRISGLMGHQPQRNRRQIHLWQQVRGREFPTEAHWTRNLVYGQRGTQHQRVSILHLYRSTENTSFSDKLLKAWMSLRRLNPLDLNRANVHKKFALPILAKSPKHNARRITEKKKKILREKKSVHTKKKPKFLRPTSIFFVY